MSHAKKNCTFLHCLPRGPEVDDKVFKSEMRKKIISTFESSKSKLIKEFNSHPVTAEIKGGPSAGNLSGTLIH